MAGLPPEIPVFIDLNPYLNVLMFVTDILEWTGVIPDPLDLLFSLFSGRPREQATVQVIQRLSKSPNAAARLWAVELSRLLTQDDIVISSGGGAQTILGAIFSQFVNNLEAQGVDAATAGNIGVFALSRAAQAGAPLEPQLQQPVPQGFFITGPQSVLDTYNQGLAQGQTLGKSGDALTQYAERYVYQHAAFSDLAKITLTQTAPTPPGGAPTPPPGGTIGSQPSPAPPSTGVPPTSTSPGGGGQPVVTLPPPPSPDPDGDELTDCCTSTATYLYAIAQALQNWAAAQNPSSPDPCCTSIVAALTNINQSANALVAILSNAGANPPAAIDLSPVVTALDGIAAAIGTLTPPPPTAPPSSGEPPTTTPPTEPAPPPTPPVDLTAINKALTDLDEKYDVPQPIIDLLVQQGYISSDFSQVLTGAPPPHVDSVALYKTIDYWASRIWKDLSTAIRRDVAIFKDGTDPGADAFAKMDSIKLSDVTNVLTTGLTNVFKTSFDITGAAAGPVVSAMLKVHSDAISKLRNVKPGEELAPATALLQEALAAGTGAHFAAVMGETIYPTKTLGFPQMAALLAELAGFKEIMRGIIGPEVTATIATPHRYAMQNQARASLPGIGLAQGLYSRRLIGDAQLAALLGYNGMSDDYAPAVTTAAFRPVSPRAIVTALADTPFPRAQVQEILEDNGYSPAHVSFMLDTLEYNSIKNVRQSYVDEVILAYKDGVLSDQEFQSDLSDLGWSDTAVSMVLSRAQLQRRVTLAQKVEAQVLPLITAGNLSAAEGQQQLTAAGVQPWYSDLVITLAETKATITAARREAAAERKLELQRQHGETQAAIKEYQVGTLNDATFAAALLAAGVDPVISATMVAVQDAIRKGKLRLLYGQLLSPQDAAILKERVDAIHSQVNELLITYQQAALQLQGLGVDQSEANALVARWAASKAAASTQGVLLTPWTGQPPPAPPAPPTPPASAA